MTVREPKFEAAESADAPAHAEPGAGGWSEFWESIEEQRAAFATEAADYAARLAATGLLAPDHDVLDFGCGFGHVARLLAPRVRSLRVWDASTSVLRKARLALEDVPNVSVVDFSAPDRLDEYAAAFDRILAHSVVQYMDVPELGAWLARWTKMLKPGGKIVLSDLLQPNVGFLRETLVIARFFWQQGIFWEVAREKLRRAKSYLTTRSERRLTLVTPEVLRQLTADGRLSVELLPENLSYRNSRLTAVLTLQR